MDAKPKVSFSDLLAEHAKALSEFENAQRSLQTAHSRETAALNKLNAAQRALDAAMDDIRKHAPRQSDWKREATGK